LKPEVVPLVRYSLNQLQEKKLEIAAGGSLKGKKEKVSGSQEKLI
jgi:hypothetical protein